MSYQATLYVLTGSRVSGGVALAYHCLAYHTGPDYLSRVGVKTVASECRMGHDEARRAVRSLVECGEIEVIEPGSPRRPTVYFMRGFAASRGVVAPTMDAQEAAKRPEKTEGASRFSSDRSGKTGVFSDRHTGPVGYRHAGAKADRHAGPSQSRKTPLGGTQGTAGVATRTGIPVRSSSSPGSRALAGRVSASAPLQGGAGARPSPPTPSSQVGTEPPADSLVRDALAQLRKIAAHQTAVILGREPMDFVGDDYEAERQRQKNELSRRYPGQREEVAT